MELTTCRCFTLDHNGIFVVRFIVIVAPNGTWSDRLLLCMNESLKVYTCVDFDLPMLPVNHYRTTGRCSGPAHYDVSIR